MKLANTDNSDAWRIEKIKDTSPVGFRQSDAP